MKWLAVIGANVAWMSSRLSVRLEKAPMARCTKHRIRTQVGVVHLIYALYVPLRLMVYT